MFRFPPKDPDEVLDYVIDFASEFGSGSNDTTESCTVVILENTSPPLNITQMGVADNTQAFFWLSGGLADSDYALDITVTTSLGRTYNGTYYIKVINK